MMIYFSDFSLQLYEVEKHFKATQSIQAQQRMSTWL